MTYKTKPGSRIDRLLNVLKEHSGWMLLADARNAAGMPSAGANRQLYDLAAAGVIEMRRNEPRRTMVRYVRAGDVFDEDEQTDGAPVRVFVSASEVKAEKVGPASVFEYAEGFA